jgi:hypothetical protein
MDAVVKPSKDSFEKFAATMEAVAHKKWDMSEATPKELQAAVEKSQQIRLKKIHRYYMLNERFPKGAAKEPLRVNYYQEYGEPEQVFLKFPVTSGNFVPAPNLCSKMNNLLHNITYTEDPNIIREFIEETPTYDCIAFIRLLARHEFIDKDSLYEKALKSTKDSFIKEATIHLVNTIEWQ